MIQNYINSAIKQNIGNVKTKKAIENHKSMVRIIMMVLG
jgi:hypothetical protein